MNRRFFLLAAPAIVAAPSLMRVSAAVLDMLPSLIRPAETVTYSFTDLVTTTLRNRGHLIAEQVMRNNAILERLILDSMTVPNGRPIPIREMKSIPRPGLLRRIFPA